MTHFDEFREDPRVLEAKKLILTALRDHQSKSEEHTSELQSH